MARDVNKDRRLALGLGPALLITTNIQLLFLYYFTLTSLQLAMAALAMAALSYGGPSYGSP